MNYFEESERHFGHSSAEVYLEFCKENAVPISKDIQYARKSHSIIISDNILDNFKVCYSKKKEILHDISPFHEVFDNFNNLSLSRYLIGREDFCTKRVLDAIQVCNSRFSYLFIDLARENKLEKIQFYTENVAAPLECVSFQEAAEIAFLSTEWYYKYIDWIKPIDMQKWHKNIFGYKNNKYLQSYVALLKNEELTLLKEIPYVVKELERRQIIGEYNNLNGIIWSADKSKVNKL